MDFLIHAVVTSVAMLVVARLIRGFQVDSMLTALLAAILLGIIHALAAPFAGRIGRIIGEFIAGTSFAYPVQMAMLFLSMLVINALILKVVAAVAPGFRINGFGSALLGAFLLVLINTLIGEALSWLQQDLSSANAQALAWPLLLPGSCGALCR